MNKRVKVFLALFLALTVVVQYSFSPQALFAFGLDNTDATVQTEEPAADDGQAADKQESTEATEPTDATEATKSADEEKAPADEATTPVDEEKAPADEAMTPADDSQIDEGKEDIKYPAKNFSDTVDGVQVNISAPEGALPEGTTVKIEDLGFFQMSKVKSAVKDELGKKASVVKAVDITFFDKDGKEIEPLEKVSVTFASKEFKDLDNAQVVHINDDGDAEKVKGSNVDGNKATFQSDDFSVYVVVETVVPRLTVKFMNGTTEIASMIIKDDDNEDEVAEIIYDPGAGDLGEGEVFKGWTTESAYTTSTEFKTIAEVRSAAMTQADSITNDTTVTYYAAIFQNYTVTYVSDDEEPVTVGTAAVAYPAYDTTGEVSYTVNMGYTVDDSHNFMGWIPETESDDNIDGHPTSDAVAVTVDGTATYYYPNGTTISIKGDVVFKAYAPEGNWLVFDENGKGATYTAPQFVLKGNRTTEPSTLDYMTRNGYTFGGWFDTKEHADSYADACAEADDPTTVEKTGEFEFGNTLTANTTVYASWVSKTSAHYTVLIWKQNIAGNGYDFAESRVLTGTVGQNVSSVVQHGTDDEAYATINGTSVRYTGFHLKNFDQDVEIVPEGSSVVNVYYDRNTYVLTFEVQRTSGTQYRYTRDDDNGTWGYVNGEWVALTEQVETQTTTTEYYLSQYSSDYGYNYRYTGTVYDANHNVVASPSYPTTYYRRTGGWNVQYVELYWYSREVTTTTYSYTYTDSEGNTQTYTGPRFTRTTVNSGNGWYTVATIVALYGQNIADYFPIVGTNGVTYDNGERWDPQSTSGSLDVIVILEIMPDKNDVFHLNTSNFDTKTMNYYVEALPGDTDTVTFNGKSFTLYNTINANLNYVDRDIDWIDLNGFTKYGSDPAFPDNGRLFYGESGTVNFYYTRNYYTVNYMDGLYVSGNDAIIQSRTTNQLTTSEEIEYGAGLSGYDITPTLPEGETGYVFEGWYMDEACNREYDFDHSTMPVDGVTVYAKWRQVQYRGFLHTGLTSDDGTNLSWGKDEEGNEVKQSLSFRVDYGGKISAPTGVRDGYKFLGWYTDSNYNNPYNEHAFVFNDTTVTEDYDMTATMTDPETKNGNNASIYGPWDVTTDGATNSDATGYNDGPRYWITKKQDLYAKWSKVLDGADGINVTYTAKGVDLNDEPVNGTKPPNDNALYLDSSPVTAGAAATAPAGYVFDHWVVCTWDEDDEKYTYTSSSTTVLPGETFTISGDDAKVETSADGKTKTYTVQLQAIYKAVEEQTPTHIDWYKNDGNDKDFPLLHKKLFSTM